MKSICRFRDLEAYGIIPLTGEACGLSYRILCDLNMQGKAIVERCLGVQIACENWNHGPDDNPHVASIMLSHEMIIPIGIFALLSDGCPVVAIYSDEHDPQFKIVVGFPIDGIDHLQPELLGYPGYVLDRSFRCGGTAGDRNVHEMTGRID